MDPVLKSLLWGIGLPVLTAGTFLFVAALTRRRGASETNAHWAVAIGCGLGFALAFLFTTGWKGWPPRDTLQWLFIAVTPAMLIGVLEGHTRLGNTAWRWLPRLVLISGLLVTQLLPRYRYHWKETQEAILYSSVLLAIWLVFYFCLERWLQRLKPGWAGLGLMLFSSAASVTLALSSSASLGQITGMAAAAAGTVWFVTIIWKHHLAWREGALAIFGTVLPALLLNGRFYSELKTDCAVLLLACPLAGWLIAVAAARSWPNRQLGPVALTGILTVLAAVILAWSRYESPAEYEW